MPALTVGGFKSRCIILNVGGRVAFVRCSLNPTLIAIGHDGFLAPLLSFFCTVALIDIPAQVCAMFPHCAFG